MMNTIVFTFVSHGQNLRIEASLNKYGMIGHGWHLFINIPAAALGDGTLRFLQLLWCGESSKPAAILKAFRNIMLSRKIQEVWRRFVRFGEFRMKLGRLGPHLRHFAACLELVGSGALRVCSAWLSVRKVRTRFFPTFLDGWGQMN